VIVFGGIERNSEFYIVKEPQNDLILLKIPISSTLKAIKRPRKPYFHFHHPVLDTKLYIKTRIRQEEGGSNS
jgi:hypothetical protein